MARIRPSKAVQAKKRAGFWKRQRALRMGLAGGRCEFTTTYQCEDGAATVRCPTPAVDVAHLDGLGMGGDREDQGDPRNALEMLRAFCREHHEIQERRDQVAAWRTRSG